MNNYLNLRERVSHGTPLLPLEYYFCRIPEEFTVLPVHWHEEMEVTLIAEGSCLYHVDLASHTVRAGDLIVILPGILHGVNERPGHAMISESFVFNLNMLGCAYPDSCTNQFLQPAVNGNMKSIFFCRPDDPGYGQLRESFRKLKGIYLKKDKFFELSLKSELFHLFELLYQFKIIRPEVQEQSNPQVVEKLRAALLYIQKNYSRPVTVAQLAEVCHFSPYHFMRFFKKHIGMTCVEYLNHYRMMTALKSLENTELSITSVALENGFNSVSYFNRQFKQAFRMTPVEYRKKHRRTSADNLPADCRTSLEDKH